MKNIDSVREKLAQHWLDAMSLDELKGFYSEKTDEYLRQEADEDVLEYARDAGIDIEGSEDEAAVIWAEIDAGMHDTSDGYAPDAVLLGDDGWSVSYAPRVEGGIRWETKVRNI